MAVPTIISITPSSGHPGGRTAVKITGTNFAVPPTPAEGETWAQTVKVEFGTREAYRVKPYGSDLVACVSPAWRGAAADSVDVDVTVTNLDPVTGDPVPGETVTEVDGFTYARPSITTHDQLKWIVENVALAMKRQIIDEVVVGAHPDYDPNQATAAIEIKSLPALVITARPTLWTKGATRYVEDGDEFTRVKASDSKAIQIDVRGITERKRDVLNLANQFEEFVQRNGMLEIPETVGDYNSTLLEVPLVMLTEPIFTPPPAGNVPFREFSATVELRHIEIGEEDSVAVAGWDFHGFDIDEIELDLEKST